MSANIYNRSLPLLYKNSVKQKIGMKVLNEMDWYYEGWVTDVDKVVALHGKATVTCYGTRRSQSYGCNARIIIKKCKLFPEFEALPTEKSTQSLRTIKEMTMKKLKQKLTEAPETVQTVTMYYVSLPSEEAHHGHSTGAGVAGYSQRMNSDVAAKLAQIVSEGVTEIKQVCYYCPLHTRTHLHIHEHTQT